MTLDQIFLLLCDRTNLRGSGKKRAKHKDTLEAPAPGPDGLIAGRTEDGEPIRLPILGESYCARVTRKWQEEQRQQREDERRQQARAERRARRQRKKERRERLKKDGS
jgi:hypothetical protein